MDRNALAQLITCMPILAWDLIGLFVGYLVSMLLGHFVVSMFHKRQSKRLNDGWKRDAKAAYEKKDLEDKRAVSPTTTGMVERAVFTIAFALYPQSALPAMGAWLALKMATHWNKARDQAPMKTQQMYNSYGILGLLSGLLSLAFAALGGLLIRWWWGYEIITKVVGSSTNG
jgi:hypothetical protein